MVHYVIDIDLLGFGETSCYDCIMQEPNSLDMRGDLQKSSPNKMCIYIL